MMTFRSEPSRQKEHVYGLTYGTRGRGGRARRVDDQRVASLAGHLVLNLAFIRHDVVRVAVELVTAAERLVTLVPSIALQ
jgi:hypothetical protein